MSTRPKSSSRAPANAGSLLTYLAGADTQLLNDHDLGARRQVHALGLLLLGVAALNATAAAIGFYLLLQPHQAETASQTIERYLLVGFMSLFWPLVVTNLFRFALASVGRPAGAALPSAHVFALGLFAKALLACILGMAIAVPITVAIIKDELQGTLTPDQENTVRELQTQIARQYRERLMNMYREQADFSEAEQSLRDQMSALDRMIKSIESSSIKGLKQPTVGGMNPQAKFDAMGRDLQRIQERSHQLGLDIASMRERSLNDQEQAARAMRNSDNLWTETGRALNHARVLYGSVAVFMALLHFLPLAVRGVSARTIEEHRAELQGEIVMARHGIEPEILVDGSNRVDRYRTAEALRALKVREYRDLREASALARAERAQEIRNRILSGEATTNSTPR